MTTRIATPVLVTVSLAVLLSGGVGAAAASTGPSDYLRPAQNAAAVGLARGHVMVFDYLSPTRTSDRFPAGSIEQAVQAQVNPAWTAEARRELHAQAATTTSGFSAEARRELKGSAPARHAEARSDAAIRELKSGAPVEVDDNLSPLGGQR